MFSGPWDSGPEMGSSGLRIWAGLGSSCRLAIVMVQGCKGAQVQGRIRRRRCDEVAGPGTYSYYHETSTRRITRVLSRIIKEVCRSGLEPGRPVDRLQSD